MKSIQRPFKQYVDHYNAPIGHTDICQKVV